MSKKLSAGFLIKSRGLYLLCHTTQDPSYKYSDSDPFWSIPKGLVDRGEGCLTAALRETKEEIGVDLLSFYPPVDRVFHKYSSKHKQYVIYFLNDVNNKLFDFPFICNSIIENERYPKRNGLPEHDMFKWVTKEEGKRLVFPSFKHVFDLV